MDGINVLTDPVWSKRPSPVSFSGPVRVHPPGLSLQDLPPIDLILISHNHYDHLDLPTIQWIVARDRPRVYTGLGNGEFLNKEGITPVTEMDWWETDAISEALQVTCAPAQHFSGRGLCDTYRTLWAGYVLESPAGSVFFAGDTGFGPHFEEIGRRFHDIRLAFLPIGAFRPEWFMSAAHLSPKEALNANFILKARNSVAMHFGTFRQGDDAQDEAPTILSAAVGRTDMRVTTFRVMAPGESRSIPPFE